MIKENNTYTHSYIIVLSDKNFFFIKFETTMHCDVRRVTKATQTEAEN